MGCVYRLPACNGMCVCSTRKLKYASPDAFIEIEKEMIDLSHNECTLALIGDLNAKTQCKDDFVEPDDTPIEALDLHMNDDIVKYLYNAQKLKQIGVPLQRSSQCKARTNNIGSK